MNASSIHNDIQEKLSHTFDASKLLTIFDQFTTSLVENEKRIAASLQLSTTLSVAVK
jgi:hypothetical protein